MMKLIITGLAIGLIVAGSIWLGLHAADTASHREQIRHRCQHIEHRSEPGFVPVSTSNSIVSVPVAIETDCYRCTDGFVECF